MPEIRATADIAGRRAEAIGIVKALARDVSNGLLDPVLEEHFGARVWTHSLMDDLRDSLCLCLNCARLNVDDPSKNCPTAQAIFEICVRDNVATAMTRCPKWEFGVTGLAKALQPDGAE